MRKGLLWDFANGLTMSCCMIGFYKGLSRVLIFRYLVEHISSQLKALRLQRKGSAIMDSRMLDMPLSKF